jgi:hypothetical protein
MISGKSKKLRISDTRYSRDTEEIRSGRIIVSTTIEMAYLAVMGTALLNLLTILKVNPLNR